MSDDPRSWSTRPRPHDSAPPTRLDLAVLLVATFSLLVLIVLG